VSTECLLGFQPAVRLRFNNTYIVGERETNNRRNGLGTLLVAVLRKPPKRTPRASDGTRAHNLFISQHDVALDAESPEGE
jgi:hypothetical protein